jgi:phospholipid/cholesterol/gamma-HCH transport system substrate-binding protein
MLKSLAGARLGLFIFFGTVLLVLAIFLVGNKDALFVSTLDIKTYFPNVEGLRTGAPVRLSGLDVGAVKSIRLLQDTTSQVEVVMRIENELIQFIRLDSEAYIETEGLVGKKIVLITPGSPDQEVIGDGGIIKSRAPVSMSKIIGETQSAISYVTKITKEFSEIAEKINQGEGTIGKVVNDDELYYSTVDIIQSADDNLNSITTRLNEVSEFVIGLGAGVESILGNVDSTMLDIRGLVEKVERGEGVLGALVTDESTYDSVKTVINNLAKTTQLAVVGVQSFVENMEALKHNWLFKNYFEERGYWSQAEYQQEIDAKIEELKEQNAILEQRLEELKELEDKFSSSESN